MFDSCLVNLQLPLMEQNPFPVSLCLCGLHIKYFLINHIHYIVMKSSVYFLFCLLAVSFLSTPLLSSREKEREGSPFDRWKAFHNQRAFPFGEIPTDAMKKAHGKVQRMIEQKGGAQVLSKQPQWELMGPKNVGGRVRSIALHPTKPDWVYIGAANGGIWRTTNAGENWEPLMDFENSSSMGQVEIDHQNPSIIYAATGEDRGGSYGYPGSGIYRSVDEGKTWAIIGLSNVGAFNAFKVHPLNSSLLFAGGANANPGFYRSVNGGANWQRTFLYSVSDISINPKNQDEVFLASPGNGIFRSSDAGQTWTDCNVMQPADYGYIKIDQSISNPAILYALIEGSADKLGYVYKSTNSGKDWTIIYESDVTFFNGQGSYDIYISIHPTNPDIVLAGGIDVFRTSDGGKKWENQTRVYTGGDNHPDQQCAVFLPSNPDIVYAGNDGGMMKSEDAGITFTPINSQLAITQYHAFAIDQSQSKMSYGGAQDNGTTSILSETYGDIVGGDGGFTLVDQVNPNTVYATTQNGNMYKVQVNTRQVSGITTGIPASDEGLFISPISMDPQDTKTIYHGRHTVYQSTNQGAKWIAISPKFSNRVSYIGVSPLRPEYIAAGTEKGDVFITADMGEKWVNVTQNGLPTRYITDIEFSRLSENTLYVTLSGSYTSHVYKSTDLGASWKNISEPLPDISANAIALYPENENILFVGTDIGVFGTYNGGETWFPFGIGFPNTSVLDMGIYEGRGAATDPISLRVATHGRAIWEVPIPEDIVQTAEIVNPIGGENYLSGSNERISWYGFTPPVKVEYSINNGETWNIIADKTNGNDVRWNIPSRFTYTGRIRISSIGDPSQSRITRTFTISELRKGSLTQASAVAHLPYGLCYDGKDGLWTTSFNDNYLYKLNSKSLVIEKKIQISQGDSLFADFTMDRSRSVFYLHKLNSTQGDGGKILEVDTTGKILRSFTTPAKKYGLGLELVDGKLIATERDGSRLMYIINLETGLTETTSPNPFQLTYGPRCLAYDGDNHLYQVCTFFPGGGSLSAVYVIKIDKNTLTEVDRLELLSNSGLINARGVEFDPSDKNLWVSSYDGAIYKVAGFETKSVSVEDDNMLTTMNQEYATELYPNPASETCFFSFIMPTDNDYAQVDIYDLLGKKSLSIFKGYVEPNSQKNINFSVKDINPGVYSVIIRSKDGSHKAMRRLIVQ